MASFTLEKKEPNWFELNIGKDSFKIPLADSLTYDEAKSFEDQSIDSLVGFFGKYIDKKIAAALTLNDWKTIMQAWQDASQKAMNPGDVTPGES